MVYRQVLAVASMRSIAAKGEMLLARLALLINEIATTQNFVTVRARNSNFEIFP